MLGILWYEGVMFKARFFSLFVYFFSAILNQVIRSNDDRKFDQGQEDDTTYDVIRTELLEFGEQNAAVFEVG